MGRRQKVQRNTFYNELTEPMLSSFTVPIPRYLLPRETRFQKARRGIGGFFTAIINTLRHLLTLALVLLLLLLFARFLLNTSQVDFGQFSYWITYLSTPLVAPFGKYLPSLVVAHYVIELAALAAMFVYLVAIVLVRKVLKWMVRR